MDDANSKSPWSLGGAWVLGLGRDKEQYYGCNRQMACTEETDRQTDRQRCRELGTTQFMEISKIPLNNLPRFRS